MIMSTITTIFFNLDSIYHVTPTADQRMAFGELISTSNSIVDAKVTVDTDQPLLWTVGYKSSL